MKKLFVVVCLILSALSVHAKAIQEDYRKAEEKARVSYAFGMVIGSNMRSAGIEYDYDAFADGFRTMIENGTAQFGEQEAIEIIEVALQRSMEKIAEENRQREAEFLASNGERPDVQTTSTGLQYEVLADTEGEKPVLNSTVRVYYTGAFIDGKSFDDSTDGEGAYIPLDMVIPGWTEGLMMMSVGSKYRFYIPSGLAYGRDGVQSIIPPYSTLVFTVELLEIINLEENETAEE